MKRIINWAPLIMDLAVLGAAAYTHVWWLLLLFIVTGSYEITENK